MRLSFTFNRSNADIASWPVRAISPLIHDDDGAIRTVAQKERGVVIVIRPTIPTVAKGCDCSTDSDAIITRYPFSRHPPGSRADFGEMLNQRDAFCRPDLGLVSQHSSGTVYVRHGILLRINDELGKSVLSNPAAAYHWLCANWAVCRINKTCGPIFAKRSPHLYRTSGSHKPIAGKVYSSTIPRTCSPMKGSMPRKIWFRVTCGGETPFR